MGMSRILIKRMRRWSALFLVLMIVAAFLAACGGGTANPPVSNVPTAAIVATPDTSTPPTPVPTMAPTQPTVAPVEPTATPVAPTPVPINPDYLEFGVVGHLYYTDRDRVLQLTKNAGFDWFRQQVVWMDIEDPVKGIYGWDELDRIVEAVNRFGIKLLVNVVRSPTAYNATNGLPDDPETLANFLEQMIRRYGNKIHAYEIWNEPNLAVENGGEIVPEDVGHYVEILKAAYTRIKSLNPDALVLAAASSSSGVTNPSIALSDQEFYRLMYTYNNGEARNYFDIQAVHPGGAANPPDTLWPDNPSYIPGCKPAPDRCWNDHETHYFRHVENVRKWMEQYGMGDKEIWITEYGWATPNNTPGYEFGNYVTPEQQAEYIRSAMLRVYDNYPFVGNMFLWNINFAVLWGEQGNPNHEQASFAILNPDWSPRLSYLRAQDTIAQIKMWQGRFVAP